MNNTPAYRKPFNPGDHGPHHNPWIIDIEQAKQDVAGYAGTLWFLAVLIAAFLVPLWAIDFDLSCKPYP